MGPRAGMDGCGKSRPPPGLDPRIVQLVASKGKGKVEPRSGHEGPEGDRYIALVFL